MKPRCNYAGIRFMMSGLIIISASLLIFYHNGGKKTQEILKNLKR